MTREEREENIENLKKLKSFHNGSYGNSIRAAIKTLEQEPCENAISRQDALDAISRIGLHKSDTKEVQVVAECLKAVEDLTPAKPQPKTEHSETVTEFADRCRECGREKVLDKIRAEIQQLTSRYTISRERGSMGQVEWADRLIREDDILQIIDKYRAEGNSEEAR